MLTTAASTTVRKFIRFQNNYQENSYIYIFSGQRNYANSRLARIIPNSHEHDSSCSVGRALNTFLTTASIFNFQFNMEFLTHWL